MFKNNWNPGQLYSNHEFETLIEGQYWNHKKKYYKEGQTTIGFLKLYDDLWLLFHIGQVTKDLNIYDGFGYEYKELAEFKKYIGRLIIKFKNRSQTMIRLAESVFDHCEIYQILPDEYETDRSKYLCDPDYFEMPIGMLTNKGYASNIFSKIEIGKATPSSEINPGMYIDKEGWKVALQNQKGIYLITDRSNGKMYVGSASGEDMILGRWKTYVKNGHGGNVELKKISLDHIKSHFEYSILEIYKSTTDDNTILQRENWWKEILGTRKFGYNLN